MNWSREQVRASAARRLRMFGLDDKGVASRLHALNVVGFFDRFPVDANRAAPSGRST